MVEDADRKRKKNDAQVGATLVKSGPAATSAQAEDAPLDKSESLFLPFAKPYNAYFNAVREAHSSRHQTAVETYTAYVKDAQYAIKARDAEALRSATEKFYAAWTELAKPADIVGSVSRAFDAYRGELMSALAAGAIAPLGPGCLAVVGYSIAAVASHQMAYQRSFSGL